MQKASKPEKTCPIVGILGGMGPGATIDLYRHITDLTPAQKDQDHIRIVIYSNPKIPDRTEAITGDGQSPLPMLIESAEILERAGAGIIAIPCNAAHPYIGAMQQSVDIPIINMIEETCRTLCRNLPNARIAGLLAATGTVRSAVYEEVLAKAGIQVVVPGESEQQRVENAIAQVKAGVHDGATQQTFESIGWQLIESGAEGLILGCTEIPLAFDPSAVNRPVLNTTKILARAVLDWALEQNK